MVWCHKRSVDYWYRVVKSQQLVSRFLKRCSHELGTDKDEKAQSSTDENETPLETVCFYTEEKQDLKTQFGGDVEGPPVPYNKKLEVEDASKEEFLFGDKFAGFFLTNGSFRIVKSVSIAPTTVKITIYSNSLSIQSEGVCKVLEKVVFNPLKAKCNFLETLLTSTEQSDDKSMERRHIVEGLIGDALALFNLSTIEKISHPNIPDFKSKTLSNKVAEELFKVDSSIKGAGYRYSTLQIDIVEEQDETKRKQREGTIKNYLAEAEIEKFEFCYVSPKETLFTYKYAAGDKCLAKGVARATLGCFTYTQNKADPLYAIVNRHFAVKSTDSNIYLEGNVKLGSVLEGSICKKGYDIAAVTVDKAIEALCQTKVRNEKGTFVRAYLHEINNTAEDYNSLQGMEVYIWGLSKKKEPGYGKILIPNYKMPKGDIHLHHVLVEDKCHERKMAIPGDSGGILCRDSMDHEDGVILILMFRGSLRDDDLLARNPGINKTYCSFLLKNGLDQLSKQTKCQFQLGAPRGSLHLAGGGD